MIDSKLENIFNSVFNINDCLLNKMKSSDTKKAFDLLT